jgi:ketosteroid isomerase-like protein
MHPIDARFSELFKKTFGLDNNEYEYFLSHFVHKELKKGSYYHKAGRISYSKAYVNKGCTRTFVKNQDGKESILFFSFEDWWLCDFASFNSGNSGTFNTEALEDCELLEITRDHWNMLRKEVPKLEHRFAEASAADSGAAVIAFASEDIRVLREGVFPAAGEDGAQLMLGSDHGKTTLRSAGGDISPSGDIAYEYGNYLTERGQGRERGNYVLIWKKNVRGTWRLAVDRRQRQAPAEKKLKE